MKRPGISFLVILIGIQTLALFLYGQKTWKQKLKTHCQWIVYLALDLLGCSVIWLLCRYVRDTQMFYSMIYTLLIQTVLCSVLFYGSFHQKLVYIVFSNTIYSGFLLLSIATAVVMSPLIPAVSLYELKMIMNIVFLIPSFLVLFFVNRMVSNIGYQLSVPAGYWCIIYFIFFLIYSGHTFVSDTLSQNNLQSVSSLLLELALLFITIAVYVMFFRMCRDYYNKTQVVLMQQQYSLQKAHFEEVQVSNQAIRELRHELKNQVFYMKYLLDQKDYPKLDQYFSEFYNKEYPVLVESTSSLNIVDAVLYQKLSYARSLGIRVVEDVIRPDGGIDEIDLCVILSNLLDNAIEACAGLEEPEIAVSMKIVKHYLSLTVCNSVSQNVMTQNPTLKSSKKDQQLHGIGLKVIRNLVEQYQGSIDTKSTDSTFQINLMLMLNKEGIPV